MKSGVVRNSMSDLDKLISQTNWSKLQIIRQKVIDIENILESVECQTPLVGCVGCVLFRGWCGKDQIRTKLNEFKDVLTCG